MVIIEKAGKCPLDPLTICVSLPLSLPNHSTSSHTECLSNYEWENIWCIHLNLIFTVWLLPRRKIPLHHQALCEQHTLMTPFTDQIWTRLPPVFYWNGSSNSDLLMSEADRCSDNDLSLTPPTQKKEQKKESPSPQALWLTLSLLLSLSPPFFLLLWLLCVPTPFSLREGLVGTCQATKVCNVDSSPFAHWLITDSMFFITCRSDPQNRHSLMCFHSWINSFLRANTSIIGCRLTWKGFVYQRAQWFFFFC